MSQDTRSAATSSLLDRLESSHARKVLWRFRNSHAHTFDSGPCQGPALCDARLAEVALREHAELLREVLDA